MTVFKKSIRHILPLLGAVLVLFAGSVSAQDYSKASRYGGRLHIPVENPPANTEIINARLDVGAKGILGCDGLSLQGLVDNQLGGLGGISDLSKDLAEAAKTALFRESITRVLANPQVASVLENMQAFGHARIELLQKRCNASEIFADVTNKRLETDAMQRCVKETGNMEVCQQRDTLEDYLEETIKDEKWSGTLHNHLCSSETDEGCDWLTLIPNHRTSVADDGSEKSTSPALMKGRGVSNMAIGFAVDVINERVRAAEEFISWFGYSEAMDAALMNEPGMPEAIEEEIARPGADFNGAKLYTLYDHTSSEACHYSTEKGVNADIAPLMEPNSNAVFPISGANINDANISGLFGPRMRPCQGCTKLHTAIDLDYPAGTGVVSAVSGVVREASYNNCEGNKVVIEGDDASLTTYQHLGEIGANISSGRAVGAGENIGTVGSSGTCTNSAMLHFSVRQNGAVVDPLAWLGGNDNALVRALGVEDGHGLTGVAAARSPDEDPDSKFVIDNHKKAAQLGLRVANTVLCNINTSLHPHVFVNMAIQPGSLGPYSRGDVVAEDADEREIFNSLASGNKSDITHGLGRVIGQHAAVSAYNAAIMEHATTIVSKSTGEGGMNKPLYRKALAELGKLKLERTSMVEDYNSSCYMAETVSRGLREQEEAIKSLSRKPFGLKGVGREPLNCAMFNYIDDDGVDELTQYTREDEDVERMRQQQAQ